MRTITGSTRLTGVIGWPVEHSLSPAMHNAAFAHLRLDWVYLPLPVRLGRLAEALRGLAALGFAGANVTVPHKADALALADALTPAARAIGAANTLIVRHDGSLLGENTDAHGFATDLAGLLASTPMTSRTTGEGRPWAAEVRALLLGAGGAARAVAYALLEGGATVAVANRSQARAAELCSAMAAAVPHAAHRIEAHPLQSALLRLAAWANVVVNATSLGLHAGDPLPWDAGVQFLPDQLVYDLIYHRPTELLALARRNGARTANGLGMLLHQGARSFELWTGRSAPLEIMRQALLECTAA